MIPIDMAATIDRYPGRNVSPGQVAILEACDSVCLFCTPPHLSLTLIIYSINHCLSYSYIYR
jgi:hypothetical protein